MMTKQTDKILFIDDEENMLHMFHRALGRQFSITTANGSEQALSLLQENGPFAVIVADYNMPDINGVELLNRAFTLSPDTVQIMLTGNIQLDVAINAINETNVFRYLPKPCPMDLLRKVIDDALDQFHLIRDKQRLTREIEQKNLQLAAMNDELTRQKYMLEYELEMAKSVYGNIVLFEENEPDGLDYYSAPKETVGGDFLLSHISKGREYFYLMVGDITGHGLQSALVVSLISNVFDDLNNNLISIEQLAQNINGKMCNKLPTGLFCSAVLAKLDKNTDSITLWQGGMPNAFLLDAEGNIVETLTSNNLPLGVLAEHDFSRSTRCYPLSHANSLFVYSDGVTEQMNQDQIMFGEDRLQTALRSGPSGSKRVELVMSALQAYQQDEPQADDISMMEMNFARVAQALAQI
ncbi:PP2C family protein-serine/threonine phosphatase [Methylicorpusculum sp.]|uniref:PP2C family protein-serine/threonine phosphatase n=3 Tax=Methylicorpusculum sp. TaxID=2713644 RepID=UPI002731E676|nr:fused response regulator/phosphatase [Methylicorpusculum sp.]MDP2180822.1 fused response regulator/phosphatase [Methylicorpusculum sp.]